MQGKRSRAIRVSDIYPFVKAGSQGRNLFFIVDDLAVQMKLTFNCTSSIAGNDVTINTITHIVRGDGRGSAAFFSHAECGIDGRFGILVSIGSIGGLVLLHRQGNLYQRHLMGKDETEGFLAAENGR